MTIQAIHIAFTLCAIVLLIAVSMGSSREGPRFLVGIVSSFALAMLVTTHMLGIGWAA